MHAERQQYRLRGVASFPLLLLLSFFLMTWLLGLALLLRLFHLLSAVVNDGLDAVAVCQQEGVCVPCAHIPHPDALRHLDEEAKRLDVKKTTQTSRHNVCDWVVPSPLRGGGRCWVTPCVQAGQRCCFPMKIPGRETHWCRHIHKLSMVKNKSV